MPMLNCTVSPTRRYVACCVRLDGGHCFRRFLLPDNQQNDSTNATWYYMNRINFESVIVGVFTAEDFEDVKDVLSYNQKENDELPGST